MRSKEFHGKGSIRYNDTERICSRLGENPHGISCSYGDVPAAVHERSMQLQERFRRQLSELITLEPDRVLPVEMETLVIGRLETTTQYPSNDIFYYHTNHLGSTAFVTDNNATVTQGFLYAPFGEIVSEYQGIAASSALPKYAFNAKELDEETGMYYYEARYMAPPTFISRDPLFEKYFWLSPYAYCANNPVKYVDPSGEEYGDYYNKNRQWQFSDGRNDGKIFVEDQENGQYMGPYKQPFYREVGAVTSIELTFTGEATNSKNSKNADVSMSEGTLTMVQHCDDGNSYVRFSLEAVSGPYGNGSLENGQYSVKNGWRRSESGYVQHGFGFCFPIIQDGFTTNRTELLIHPDGNNLGIKGCIGISADLFTLKDFYKTMNLSIEKYGNIPLTVDVLNNVNNNGSTSNASKLNE